MLPDGMRIRGDVNVCLMGDPGVGQEPAAEARDRHGAAGCVHDGEGEQRGGADGGDHKGRNDGGAGAGGGALVLADRGICAIDDFDK